MFRLTGFQRPARLRYTADWLKAISAGAFILGLLSPDLVGGRMWLAILVVGVPADALGFWLAGAGKEEEGAE